MDTDYKVLSEMIIKKEKRKRDTHKLVIINEEELIRQVEMRPLLYDKSLRGYRKSTLRDQSWKEIATMLNSSVEECRKRWRSLRDAFARHHKHVTDDDPSMSKKKKWLYYDQMYFLAPYLECSGNPLEDTTQISTLDNNSHGSIIMETEEHVDEIEENCNYKVAHEKVEYHQNHHHEGDTEHHTDTDQTIDLYDENQVMTRIFASPGSYQIAECKSNKPIPETGTETYTAIATTDPDERFLLSCSPILKRLPNKKNALARLKIQQILYNIEFGE